MRVDELLRFDVVEGDERRGGRACVVQRSESGDLGGLWLEGHGLLVGSKVLGRLTCGHADVPPDALYPVLLRLQIGRGQAPVAAGRLDRKRAAAIAERLVVCEDVAPRAVRQVDRAERRASVWHERGGMG